MELIFGGFFSGSNRAYLNGRKVCYDFCDASQACMQMLYELVEHLGYETAGRIAIYLLLPGMQMNEGGLKLLTRNNDTDIIRKLVREGYKYLMFYLDHEDNYGEGGWYDVVANPSTHLPPMISPRKSSREESTVEHSHIVVEENTSELMYAGDSTCEGTSSGSRSRRSKRAIIEEEEDEGPGSGSDDSDYDPEELMDSDYDLQDGDEDLVMDESHAIDDEKKGKMKGKMIAEDDNSEDEKLEMAESDDEEMKFKFKHFTEEDLHEPKFHVGQVFSSIELITKAIREYSCKERLAITFPKNDKTRVGAKCTHGICMHHMTIEQRELW